MEESLDLPRLLVAAPASGSGKTTVTCALLRAFQRRGLEPCAFKCGPDYIDPMFHREVLGLPSRNLDLFFSGEDQACALLSSAGRGHGVAVLEGVMGCYDGVGGTERASSWHLAQATGTPILLVVRPQGAALTLAAMVQGLARFRSPSMIGGILLNGCSRGLAELLTPMLQQETGLPVLGWLPQLSDCAIASRHLGLLTPGEVQGLAEKVDRLASQLEETVDLEGVLALARSAASLPAAPSVVPPEPEGPVVAVARDRAFCFYYEDNLDLLRQNGLHLAEFSPLEDRALPAGTCGLYLGGGYPELWAEQLSWNAPMRRAVREAIRGGMPALAECGGFLYLQSSLEDPEGRAWPMAGVLEGEGTRSRERQPFGYLTLRPEGDNPYLVPGEEIAGHEFHRWACTQPGDACRAVRPTGGDPRPCIICKGKMLAGFPHLYLPSNPRFAARFAAACIQYQKETTL